MFDVIALDADDTLWDNEYLYSEARKKFILLLTECQSPEECGQRLDEIEMENVRYYGYGIKSFILSMIQAALEIIRRPGGRRKDRRHPWLRPGDALGGGAGHRWRGRNIGLLVPEPSTDVDH